MFAIRVLNSEIAFFFTSSAFLFCSLQHSTTHYFRDLSLIGRFGVPGGWRTLRRVFAACSSAAKMKGETMGKYAPTDVVTLKTDRELAECLARWEPANQVQGSPRQTPWSEERIAALTMLQRRYRPFVEFILRAHGVRSGDLDLLCDQVLDALWRCQINPTMSVQSWLAVIARRKAISYGRRRRPKAFADCGAVVQELAFEPQVVDHRQPTPDQQAMAREHAEGLSELMCDLLQSLSPNEREILEMFYRDDLPVCEIAQRRRQTPKQTSAGKYRALNNLRRRLEVRQAT